MATTNRFHSLHAAVYFIARRWIQLITGVAGIVEAAIITTLLGFSTFPSDAPIVIFVRQNAWLTMCIGTVLLLISITCLRILQGYPMLSHELETSRLVIAGSGRDGTRSNKNRRGALPARILLPTAVSTISMGLFVALLIVVLVRPSWCPSTICPAARVIVSVNPHGVHDANLDMYFTGLQGTTYEIPGNPAQYTVSDIPKSIGVVRLDQSPSVVPYRVVISVHSLLQGTFALRLTRIEVVVANTPPTPDPLNVWTTQSDVFPSHPFLAVFRGEQSRTALIASSESSVVTAIRLTPGETDTIALRLGSVVPANVLFRIQVRYRVENESEEHLLTLPTLFNAVFTDATNWHLYNFQDGRFLPAGHA